MLGTIRPLVPLDKSEVQCLAKKHSGSSNRLFEINVNPETLRKKPPEATGGNWAPGNR